MPEALARIIAAVIVRNRLGESFMMVELSDGTITDAFTYFRDEIQFSVNEVLGRTLRQAQALHAYKDVTYLGGPAQHHLDAYNSVA
jgi:hypothetical protein